MSDSNTPDNNNPLQGNELPSSSATPRVDHHPDDGSAPEADGISIEANANGGYAMSLPKIKRIEIADMMAVASHRIRDMMGSTCHVIRFLDGGVIAIAYDRQGQLLSAESKGIHFTFNGDGVICLGRPLRHTDKTRADFGGKI